MLVFDLESDGLYNDVTKIHCLAIYDSETDETIAYNDVGNCEPISRGVQRLEDAEIIAGHNVISYDIPVLQKNLPVVLARCVSCRHIVAVTFVPQQYD